MSVIFMMRPGRSIDLVTILETCGHPLIKSYFMHHAFFRRGRWNGDWADGRGNCRIRLCIEAISRRTLLKNGNGRNR